MKLSDLAIGTEVFVLKFTKRSGYSVSPVRVTYNYGEMVHCDGYTFHCPHESFSEEDPIGEKIIHTPTEVTELYLFPTREGAHQWIERKEILGWLHSYSKISYRYCSTEQLKQVMGILLVGFDKAVRK